MKCLKIKAGKGQFLNKDGQYVDIDKMNKTDILNLLDIAIDENETFEFDIMNDTNIVNPAHRIIYQNISEKFAELVRNKEQFLDESEALYNEAMRKYR